MALKKFLYKRLLGCGYAFKGAVTLLRTEPSVQVQAIIAVIMTALGFYFNITTTQWLIQCLCIGSIMSLEGVNTAIEGIADFIHPEHHSKIGFIKDVAAGAVFFMAVISVIIGVIIYLPYIRLVFI